MAWHKKRKLFFNIDRLKKEGYLKGDFLIANEELEKLETYRTDVPYNAMRLYRENETLFPVTYEKYGIGHIDSTKPIVKRQYNKELNCIDVYMCNLEDWIKYGCKCFVVSEEFCTYYTFTYLTTGGDELKLEGRDTHLGEKGVKFRVFNSQGVKYINPLNFIDPTQFDDRPEPEVFEPQGYMEKELGLYALDVEGEEDFVLYRKINGLYIRQKVTATDLEKGNGRLFYGWEHEGQLYWRTAQEDITYVYERSYTEEGSEKFFAVILRTANQNILEIKKKLETEVEKEIDNYIWKVGEYSPDEKIYIKEI
jgi:hypothetical protein